MRTLLCDASTDAAFRRELIARWRLGDRSGAHGVLRRVASLRPECPILEVLQRSTAANLDPGLVLEQPEASLMRREVTRAPVDETSTQGHALGIAGAVLGVLAVVTTYAGAASSSCDYVPFGSSCDVTPRTALLATGVFSASSRPR